MVAAVIVTVLVLVALSLVAVGVYAVVRGRKAENVSVKRDVSAIQSVGVKSSLSEDARRAADSAVAARPTSSSHQPVANPGDALARRFAGVGVLAAGIFGALAARLWNMQVIEGDSYARQAEGNQYTTVYTPAPRGYILDADGVAIVGNSLSLTVLADADVADDANVVGRLSAVLGLPTGVVRNRINDASGGAQSQRVVASGARRRDVAFIAEHADAFPGVTVQTRTVRSYPYGALAAHVVGYTGAVTEDDMAQVAAGRDLESGDEVGRAGIEQFYDNLLAGDHGERKVMADAQGNIVEVVSETQPVKGSDVYLTIKAPVQYVADKALADLIAPSGVIGEGKGVGGTVVVMEVNTGDVIAMASYPTFTPATFIGGITQDEMDVYQAESSFSPLLNRAVQGSYPAASTYKTFTGLAALENGVASSTSTWDCTGSWDGWNTGSPQACWKKSGHGTLDFRGGIVNSCDVVFYDIGYNFWAAAQAGRASETALQDFLSRYRFDQLTGIDLGGETTGRIPTPAWKASYFRDYPESAQWQGGDYTNMCIGQGYVLVTPMEMAVAYGAIATGSIVKPHLLKEVRNGNGDVALSFTPEVVDTPEVSMADLAVVRDALKGVTTENADTAALFNAVGIDPATVACKTGTAEYTDQEDTAWFVCYAPYDDPKYVVACLVEHGGGGASVAAPLGAQVLAAAYAADAGTLADVGQIAGSSGQSTEDAGAATAGNGRTD